MTKILTVALTVAVLLLGNSGTARALKFHATLSSIKVQALPGQTVNRSFRLTLDKEEARTQFKLHVEDWWRSEDGKQSFYREPGTLKHSCAPWIKLNPVEAAVDPGGTLDARLTISAPADVKPGGYWCVLTVDQVLDPLKARPEGVGVQFLASVSIGIFVTIAPVDRNARILDVQVHPQEAMVKLRNDGNCPLGVEGRFEFVHPGDPKPTLVVPMTRTTVLPEPITTALITVALPGETTLPAGRYLVRVILDIGIDHYIGVQKEVEFSRAIPVSTPDVAKPK